MSNETPVKCFRIPLELYEAAQAAAEMRNETLSEVVRKGLQRYVNRSKATITEKE